MMTGWYETCSVKCTYLGKRNVCTLKSYIYIKEMMTRWYDTRYVK